MFIPTLLNVKLPFKSWELDFCLLSELYLHDTSYDNYKYQRLMKSLKLQKNGQPKRIYFCDKVNFM